MNHTRETITDDNGSDFDPAQAAALLMQTTRQARQQLEPNPPWLLATRAALGLVAYGAIWLSVRGQHPYEHPTTAVIPVGVAAGVLNVIATVAVAKHAAAGVAGRSRLRPVETAVMAAVWIAGFAAICPLGRGGGGT